jgi:DNA-binding NtrC family response regulator
MTNKATILIIDDEEGIRDSCSQVLNQEGYLVNIADNGKTGWENFKKSPTDVVLLDLKLPGLNGMEVLEKIKKMSPDSPVIIITGFATIESAVNTMKRGAFDYLAKPFSPQELRVIVKKALDSRKTQETSLTPGLKTARDDNFTMVKGKSKSMAKVLDIVKRVSPTESTVLITGESGTGKELLAAEIHNHSPRKNAPFVVVDCGALVETLFESELFGHVKGSFTGASMTKHGRFEVADGGTIFLDEISNISLNIQAKLLRAIQEREVTRIGNTKPITVDIRILAATHENLADCVRKGKFREDLFYRLSVVPIHIPPLSERKEDIPLLLNHFLLKHSKKSGMKLKIPSPKATKALLEHEWPGNIRELENTVERAMVLCQKDRIELEDLFYHGISLRPSFLQPAEEGYKSLKEIEKDYIKIVLQSQYGNRTKTAKILSIDRKTLLSKIKKYNLS